jgi:hypothetical protein
MPKKRNSNKKKKKKKKKVRQRAEPPLFARELLALYEACTAELRLETSDLRRAVSDAAAKAKAEVLENSASGNNGVIVDDPKVESSIRGALFMQYARVGLFTIIIPAVEEGRVIFPQTAVNAMTNQNALSKTELETLRHDVLTSGLAKKINAAHEAFALAERHAVTAAVEGEAAAAARSAREEERQRLVKEVQAELEADMAARNPDEQAALLKAIGADAQALVKQLKARGAAGEDIDLYVMDVMPVEDQRPLIRMQAVQAFIHRHEVNLAQKFRQRKMIKRPNISMSSYT